MGKMKPNKPGGPPKMAPRPAAAPFRPQAPRPQATPFRPQAPRPQAIQPRPAAPTLKIGSNAHRQDAREARREAYNQTANQQSLHPRPSVRPAAPPIRIMPKPAAPQAGAPLVRPGAQQGTLSSAVRPGAKPVRPGALRPAGAPTPAGSPKGFQKPGAAPSGLKSTGRDVRPGTPAVGAQGQTVRPGMGAAAGLPAAAMLAGLALNVGSAHPQIATDVSVLNGNLQDLGGRSTLQNLQTQVNELDANLNRATTLLESARSKGYVYQKDLDEIAYAAMDRWQAVRDQVLNSIPQQSAAFQNRLVSLNGQVARLNSVVGNPAAATPLLSSTSSQVNTFMSDLNQIESSLQANYADIQSQTSTLASRLNQIHWALGQLGEAKFKLGGGENLVMAVPARWDQVGDNDPEGILYLTNKRIIYERKEKVATKKILFVSVSQELVQEVMIDQPLTALQDAKAVSKGLFGHQDFVEAKFADGKLGEVPFHLNGQNCATWVTLINRAKSGDIENDRSTGSGISIADLTGPLTASNLMALQADVNALQDTVTLKPVREELAQIENDMRSLERSLSGLRSRGYAIEKSLEGDVTVLASQWDRIKTNAMLTLDNQTKLLSEQMVSLQKSMAELLGMANNLNAARPLFMQVKSAQASLEAQADAADDSVIAQYDQYADEVESLAAHMEWVGWMLDALSTASFQLLATESGVAATEAVWARPGLEPENGILFLTDQRLLWEDRVGDYELKLNVPLAQVEGVQKEVDEATGVEFLDFRLASGAPYPSAKVELALPVADAWLKMVGRARSGGYDKDRAEEIDQSELERIKNAPRQCTNCGAGLTAPILRGQTSITCEYCGQVINI